MRCQADDCYKKVAGHNSDHCLMHKGKRTFDYYQAWDEERWEDRISLLSMMWDMSEPPEQKKRLIADLIIHAHDFYE